MRPGPPRVEGRTTNTTTTMFSNIKVTDKETTKLEVVRKVIHSLDNTVNIDLEMFRF